jgi:putative hydrolase of HD superfamily
MKELDKVSDFLFEVGMLAKTPRSGFFFLGSGQQSVAEHINRVTYVGYVLCKMIEGVDSAKVMQMCLFHDLAEARTSDLNYVHQKYVKADEDKALTHIAESLPFGEEIKQLVVERNSGASIESKIAKDADRIEWILSLKEQVDIGNTKAKDWLESAVKRIETNEAKQLAEAILSSDSDRWWFGDKNDQWWVTRNKE